MQAQTPNLLKMKKSTIFLLILLIINSINAQVKYESFESTKLKETRELKIQLPRSYSYNDDKSYPIFIVLDGDYLFEAVAGNVDYYAYWEEMPEAIVVGVNQLDKRYDDCMYSEQNSLPIDTGAAFYEFIGLELIPYIEKTYRTANFKVAIGHDETANFINYFLLKPQPLFQAYVVISPELAPDMLNYIPQRLKEIESKTFYYLAHTAKDRPAVTVMTKALHKEISALKNENILYSYNSFDNPSHYAVPTYALPKALEHIFYAYQPISKKEYLEVILKLESSPVAYLQEKYQNITDVYRIEKPILVNDFNAISAAIEKNQSFEYYEDLAKMAGQEYPKTILSHYYLGRFYEETGKPKKAMHIYQSAYSLSEIGGITQELLLEKADLIKTDFGY